MSAVQTATAVDAFTAEVIRNVVVAITREMMTNLMRTAYSLPNSRRELMSIDKPCKRHPLELVHSGNGQQIVILTEQDALQCGHMAE